MPRAAVTCGLAALLFVASPALAQDPQRPRGREGAVGSVQAPRPVRDADGRVGPFFLRPRLSLSFGWDDNVTGATGPDEPLSDLLATGSGGAVLQAPIGEKHVISADGQLDYLWFRENAQFRNFNWALAGAYEFRSQSVRLRLSDRFFDRDRKVSPAELSDPIADSPQRISEAVNQAEATLAVDISNRVFLASSASRSTYRIGEEEGVSDAEIAERLDRTEHALEGSLGFQVGRRTTVEAVYEYGQLDFRSPDNFRDWKSNRAAARLNVEESERPFGLLTLGYRRLTPEVPGQIGFKGLTVDASVSLTSGHVRVRGYGSRDVEPSFYFDSVYFVREGGGLEFTYQFDRDVGISVGGSRFDHSYPNEAPLVGPGGTVTLTRRLDKTYAADATLRYQISAEGSLIVRASYYDWVSNFPDFDTSGLEVTSGYSVVF